MLYCCNALFISIVAFNLRNSGSGLSFKSSLYCGLLDKGGGPARALI